MDERMKKMLKSGKMSPRKLLDHENKRYDWFDVALCIGLPLLILFGAIFCIILNKGG